MDNLQCPKRERERIQYEESELWSHLNWFLQEYESARSAWQEAVDSFWIRWWTTVDEILPVLEPRERCNHNFSNSWKCLDEEKEPQTHKVEKRRRLEEEEH
jgi:hypothetical protein